MPINDTDKKDNTSSMKSMENLLDEFDYECPERGQILEAEILLVDEDSILVDVGGKRDAIVPREDIKKLDDEFFESLSPGEVIPVWVLQPPTPEDDFLVSINHGLETKDWEKAQDYIENEKNTNLEVTDWNRGGLLVQFGKLQGFVPNSHVPEFWGLANQDELESAKDEKIGSNLDLKVIDVDRDQRRLVLSAKAARAEMRKEQISQLEEGQIIKGIVRRIVDFGAFVDLGGIKGLIHISEMEWYRVSDPTKIVSVGEEVETKIISIDVEKERISLSLKALRPNPWDLVDKKFSIGDVIEGTITNICSYGVFVRLPMGVEGLLHESEIEDAEMYLENAETGSQVKLLVIQIDAENERMGFSQRKYADQEKLNELQQMYSGD